MMLSKYLEREVLLLKAHKMVSKEIKGLSTI